MGEMHTDLLQIMEQSQADEPFDLLNNEWVKKKKRGYVNSGRVKFKTCEVYVQRSSIAVIGLMLAIETGLHYQAFKDIQSRFMKGAKVKKIEAAALPAQPPPPTGPANVSVVRTKK